MRPDDARAMITPRLRGIPGPRCALLNERAIYADQTGFHRELAARYGVWVSLPLFRGKILLATDSVTAKAVIALPAKSIRPCHIGPFEKLLGMPNIFSAVGEEHHRLRQLYWTKMRKTSVIDTQIMPVDRNWLANCARAYSETSQRESLASATTEMALAAAFGEPKSLADAGRLAQLTRDAVNSIGPSLTMNPFFHQGWNPEFRRYKRTMLSLSGYWGERLQVHRRSSNSVPEWLQAFVPNLSGNGRADAMAKHYLMTWIGGFSVLAATMEEILNRMAADRDLIHVVRDEGDPNGKWTSAVVKEALRIRSPGIELTRTLVRPCDVGGMTLQEGVSIGVSIGAVHHHHDLYENPSTFRADRFIDSRFGPSEFLPFGGGARRCIGAHFARSLLGQFTASAAIGYASVAR